MAFLFTRTHDSPGSSSTKHVNPLSHFEPTFLSLFRTIFFNSITVKNVTFNCFNPPSTKKCNHTSSHTLSLLTITKHNEPQAHPTASKHTQYYTTVKPYTSTHHCSHAYPTVHAMPNFITTISDELKHQTPMHYSRHTPINIDDITVAIRIKYPLCCVIYFFNCVFNFLFDCVVHVLDVCI